ncbi:MAG: hypothetical protein IIA54_04100, partial [Chloroflexi bacterium]|nr:hypothetical protein [Chloroflexota bacterium]
MCKIRRGPTIDCSRRGTFSLFGADFEADTAGALPTTPANGPPGVALNMTGDPGTITVIDPSATGSKSLSIARGSVPHTRVDAVPGSLDGNRILSGIHYIDYQAYGEVIPEFPISSHAIWIEDANGDRAFTLRLHNGAYHLLVGSELKKLGGSYDASKPHGIHVELNLDTKRYSICID